MTSALEEPRVLRASSHFPGPEDPDLLTAEQAETILEQMAAAAAPTVSVGQLARSLSDGLLGQTVERVHVPGTSSARAGHEHGAEELLRKAQARYRALVEQIPAITFMAPLDGTVSELYVSPQIENMLGFTAEEWLNNPILWFQQLHPEDKDRWQADFARTLNAGEHFRSDYRFISRDGRTVWIHGEAKVISDENGRPLFLQGVAFDITERMEAEVLLRRNNLELARARDQAMEASRAKSAFLANMSHELRTPLHAIVGFAEMLQEDAADAGHDAFLPDLMKITGSARHLVGLISNILDISKIEAGKMDLFLEDFALEPLVEEVVSTVLPLTQENGNTLHVRCASDLGVIHADATKLRQVLFNLLSNANKFTERGAVTLEATRERTPAGEVVHVRVSDSGIGIAPHQKEKLFRSFSQVDDSTTRKYGGTGLGLAISHRFCQMMGGSITVASDLGKGSTFAVQLPVHVVAVEPAEMPQPHFEPSSAAAACTEEVPAVLVIDDDAQALDLMQRFLTREGLRILAASSSAEAVRMARDVRPLAIVLDVSIPDMNGWSVLTALKSDPHLADIPVVLCTRAGGSDQGCPLGAADFLTKPIDWKRLSQVLAGFRSPKGTARVLVVDDDPDCRELMCRAAGGDGWEAVGAANGWIALKSVVEAPPDLILLDLMMPEMDGFEFLRLLRSSQTGQTIPLVVVTARELTTDERLRLSGSVHKILQKGAFARDELFAEIEALVTGHVRQRRRAPASSVPAAGGDGAVAEVPVIGELQRQLEQACAERDAALAQVRQLAEPPCAAAARSDAEAELEQTLQLLREQQQAVELLRAECEEHEDLQTSLGELQGEIECLRLERDEAQARASRAQAGPPELAALVRQLQQEVEQMRQGATGAETGRGETPRPARKRRRRTPAEPAPLERAAKSSGGFVVRSSEAQWHVNFDDLHGEQHLITGSTDDVRAWLEQGLLNAASTTLSRTPDGPFRPLAAFAEFREQDDQPAAPVGPTPRLVLTRSMAQIELPVAAQATAPAPVEPARGRLSEVLMWMLPVVLALLAALVLGHRLFG
jgi:PAS domain S-box-containing protein